MASSRSQRHLLGLSSSKCPGGSGGQGSASSPWPCAQPHAQPTLEDLDKATPMMSERTSSFRTVNTSWMRVAQRTLRLFTHVKGTAEEGQEGRVGEPGTHEGEPSWVGHGQVSPAGTGCLMQQPERVPEAPGPEAQLHGGLAAGGMPPQVLH